MSEEMVFKRQLDEAQDLAVEMADHARDRIRSFECGGDLEALHASAAVPS